MKYEIGTKVKINMDTLDNCGWAVLALIESYPDGVFTIESHRMVSTDVSVTWGYGLQVENCKPDNIYLIVVEPNQTGSDRYEIREHNLISLVEMRDSKINKILQ